ncbi:asparagine--tRNA ligase [Desulfoluna butyratoxydans]|uniref:Asparagine--tRNA ligase n=1 Tax=Desulfoluna butyratoxydans TaxID=231438 RepID=A0A4U8YKX4_9BACT|nr:asparagine--tRNA ligase [Desulfoluna butyratoxydans]VFQ43789.1 asparagine-trna ligase [Desulfoluna butyratoxydans]
MNRTKIKALLARTAPLEKVLIKGWVRTRRDTKEFSFLEINDGSCLASIQVIVDAGSPGSEHLPDLSTGAAVAVTGEMVPSPGKGQAFEIRSHALEFVGGSGGDAYPLQKKRHSDEFLRTIAHLRARTNKYGAIMRIRSRTSHLIHRFFEEEGFFLIHTPVITGSDCEGAGEMFRITTVKGTTPASEDFFGKETNLTVSGQLSAEMMALALGDVYTFGPTFRAENSHTSRHAAEFWMLEPEMAFCDLAGNMDVAEALIKYVVKGVLETCSEDITLFAKFVDKTLMATLTSLRDDTYERLPYKEAVEILQNAKKKFEYPVSFGIDLQSEHERYLAEEHFKKPVFVYNYPKGIKPFYMRVNDDNETVAAMDLLVPRIGELVGGSQREEREDVLRKRMADMNLPEEEYWWYLDSRRFGSVPHSGFGLGFERLLMLLTGITNIRDVIAFPRTPGSIDF